jgi:hypothetical protein
LHTWSPRPGVIHPGVLTIDSFCEFVQKSVLFNRKQFGVRVFRIYRGYQIWLAFFIRLAFRLRRSLSDGSFYTASEGAKDEKQ